MKNAILTLRFIHLIFLLLVLLTLTVIPFYYPMTPVTAFVVFPLLYIMVLSVSVVIEQKLNLLLKQLGRLDSRVYKEHKKCPVIKGLCC
ncbi:hypothetical protein [Thalassotalea marina]|uniref:Uncharacterized protein n=1 Tax=Thalassotalea marina TaxID=1673741 RepID=A0A919BJN8_9GAMM|nr:hypothetical protein [Thalassotalea marina]GHF96528.1 hypothetical protein GCM10017161_26110 [Thalassotalea marina]